MNCERTETLLGAEAMNRLRAMHVAVYGLGGVGGWCAEALLRSGVGKLTIIDDDLVQESNLNRQCCATAKTVGRKKCEAMAERLREIDPEAKIVAIGERFVPGMAAVECDAIVDAIDSVDCKCALILAAQAQGIPVFSSLGAAKRLDPTKVELKRFKKVEGDALARAMRQRFRKIESDRVEKGRLGSDAKGHQETLKDFICAVSGESPVECEGLGSMMPVTAAFGLALASAVIGNSAV